MSPIPSCLSKTNYSLLQSIIFCWVCVFEFVCCKLLATAAMVAVVVAAGPAGCGGGRDVIQAGLVLQQGYITAEHHTNWTQNPNFKQCNL